MVMSWIWAGMIALSIVCALVNGSGAALSAAVLSGAQTGVQLAFSIAGSILLWSGVGELARRTGLADALARLLRPVLGRVFPGMKKDGALAESLSANVCANLLGLGNAATPMGIDAVRRMRDSSDPTRATDEMCRLIVLNTASIQLLPTNVAAVRSALGCVTPFDILPAVWVSSILSASAGVAAAWMLGKLWRE